MIYRFLLLFGVVLTASCQMQALRQTSADPLADPAFALPAGSTLTLLSEAPVPVGTAGVWLQSGQWVDRDSDIDHYRPFCRLETWDLVMADEGAIRPETFRIVSSHFETEIGAYTPYQKLAQVIMSNPSGGITYVIVHRNIMLGSDSQPNVYRLRCGVWEALNDADGVSINEINELADGLLKIEVTR